MTVEIPLETEKYLQSAYDLIDSLCNDEKKVKSAKKKIKVLIEAAIFSGAGNEVLKKALETQFQENYFDDGYQRGYSEGYETGQRHGQFE